MTTLFPESLLTRWERGTSLVEEMGTDDPTEALKIIARWIRQETRGSDGGPSGQVTDGPMSGLHTTTTTDAGKSPAPSSYLAAPAEGPDVRGDTKADLQCGWCGNIVTHACPDRAKALAFCRGEPAEGLREAAQEMVVARDAWLSCRDDDDDCGHRLDAAHDALRAALEDDR